MSRIVSPMRLVADERHAHDLGDRLARDVVLRRAEPAATITASLRSRADLQRLDDAVEVVADLGLEVRVDAGQRELLADPRRVGVDDLAEQQLGADGDDFTAHDRQLPTWHAPPVARSPARAMSSPRSDRRAGTARR